MQGKPYTKEERDEILETLRPYLEMGYSRSKSCKLIGLDESTLSKWVNRYETVSMKVQSWENAINNVVLSNLKDAIELEGKTDDDKKETTKWWAERKMKNEGFSTRQEHTGADGSDIKINLVTYGDNNTS